MSFSSDNTYIIWTRVRKTRRQHLMCIFLRNCPLKYKTSLCSIFFQRLFLIYLLGRKLPAPLTVHIMWQNKNITLLHILKSGGIFMQLRKSQETSGIMKRMACHLCITYLLSLTLSLHDNRACEPTFLNVSSHKTNGERWCYCEGILACSSRSNPIKRSELRAFAP